MSGILLSVQLLLKLLLLLLLERLLLRRMNLHRLSSVLRLLLLLLLLLDVELLELLRGVLRLLGVLLLLLLGKDGLLGCGRRRRSSAARDDRREGLARLPVVGQLGVGGVERVAHEEGVGVDDLSGGGRGQSEERGKERKKGRTDPSSL